MKRKLARKLKEKMVAGPTMIQGAEVVAEAEVVEEATVEVIKVTATGHNISKVTAITAELGVTSRIIVGTNLRTHICVSNANCRPFQNQEATGANIEIVLRFVEVESKE